MKIACLFLLLILSGLVGCSGLEQSEEKRIRERNLTITPIQRQSDETFFALSPPISKKKEPYPWETRRIGSHLRITKEFFRCRGEAENPPIQIFRGSQMVYHRDCGGIERHSLPLRSGEEFIYPILIDLLNYVQEKLERRVIITCGHRCPAHNLYADPSKGARISKHLIGAEVDFYVEGLEHQPQEVIDLLLSYYPEPMRRSSHLAPTSTLSWYNKEVGITLYLSTEGRDLDNCHPYPYISIQVRHDTETGRPVQYNWHRAHNGFTKY